MARNQRLYRSVMKKLQHLIDAGEYPPGGRLPPERELAERFEVSRPTVREAIIALEATNRVEVKTGSGVYVLAPSSSINGIDVSISAFELTEARALIEGEAAALAATMITDEQLIELEKALHEMADEPEGSDQISEVADQSFHHIISQATQNKMLSSVIDHLWYIRNNSPAVHKAYQSICSTDSKALVQEHQDIYDALARRDAAATRIAMHEHFARILNKLIVANENEQVEEARKRATESRRRFSLGHLVSEG
ncbi:MAG: FadR/GntR family transcriptional regulator [Woeseiaceae bacterium]